MVRLTNFGHAERARRDEARQREGGRPKRCNLQMRALDKIIDDGNLGTGEFRARSDGYIGIIEE